LSVGQEKLIVALDLDTEQEALSMVDLLSEEVEIFKVGPRLFFQSGPRIVKKIHRRQKKIFLDLKLYDIPQTVAKSAEVITEMGVFMFNLHLSGGEEMIRRTVEAVAAYSQRRKITKPLILGVTILTSFNQLELKELWGKRMDLTEAVLRLAELGRRCGLDGVVSSAWEIERIRKKCGRDFVILTPGVRLPENKSDDQKRITTPQEAVRKSANFIVVGRPVIRAPEPRKMVRQIIKNLEEGEDG
jgi:orotidine-5'-phosphate decarboxylase